MSFPGASAGLNLFQAPGLVSESSLQLGSDREGTSESTQFQGVLEALLLLLLLFTCLLKELPGRMEEEKPVSCHLDCCLCTVTGCA